MTTRRTLERAVIEAAAALIEADRFKPLIFGVRLMDLTHAVDALDAAPLETTKVPKASVLHPETSWEAARSMRERIAGDLKLVLDAIEVQCRFGGSGLGYTVDQLEQRLSRSHQSISARVNNLREMGWIVDSGVRRETRSGRQAIVWTLSDKAKEALHGVG